MRTESAFCVRANARCEGVRRARTAVREDAATQEARANESRTWPSCLDRPESPPRREGEGTLVSPPLPPAPLACVARAPSSRLSHASRPWRCGITHHLVRATLYPTADTASLAMPRSRSALTHDPLFLPRPPRRQPPFSGVFNGVDFDKISSDLDKNWGGEGSGAWARSRGNFGVANLHIRS